MFRDKKYLSLVVNDLIHFPVFLIPNYLFQIIIYYDSAIKKDFNYATLFAQSILISIIQLFGDYAPHPKNTSIFQRIILRFLTLYTINLVFQQLFYKQNVCIVNNNCDELYKGNIYLKISLFTILSTALLITLTEIYYFPCCNFYATELMMKPSRRYGKSNYNKSLLERYHSRNFLNENNNKLHPLFKSVKN